MAFGLASTGVISYMRFVEPRWLDVAQHALCVHPARPQNPLRLLHLSDLHASAVVSLDFIRQAIETGLALEPDLACVTGDFVATAWEAYDRYAEVLAILSQRVPTFACLGNHDGGQWSARHHGYPTTREISALLAQARLELLTNRSQAVQVREWKLNLVGVGDFWAGEFDAPSAFAQVAHAPDATTVLLSHNPDTKDQLLPYAWDLLLCGHTHGGQLELPVLGTPFAPVKDRRYVKGLHRWNNRWLHISKGVGNEWGMRLNCRPEICLLTLT
jgi:uncharacterized protein